MKWRPQPNAEGVQPPPHLALTGGNPQIFRGSVEPWLEDLARRDLQPWYKHTVDKYEHTVDKLVVNILPLRIQNASVHFESSAAGH